MEDDKVPKRRNPFSAWVFARRQELGLTLKQVGALLERSGSYVRQHENLLPIHRNPRPSVYRVKRLCDALGLNVQEGLRLAGHPPMTEEEIETVMVIAEKISAASRRVGRGPHGRSV